MKSLNVYAAIVGAGASGLMCACFASKKHKNKKIIVIEKADRVGKKILVSGNGRCNLTNLYAKTDNYHTSFESGVNFLLSKYSPDKIISYFESIGLVCKPDSDGRVYPLSRQSSAVLSVLRNELRRNNVEELVDTEVQKIVKAKGGYKLLCGDTTVYAEKVVIATGGKNNYAQKVIGNPYAAAESVGHNITKLSPSLCPVKVKSNVIKSLKGIRAAATVSAIIGGKIIKSEAGEIQFTADALSGICVFNISRLVNNVNNAVVRVKLLSDYSFNEINNMIISRVQLVNTDNVQEIFTGLFHKNIGIALLKMCGIDTARSALSLSGKEIERLSAVIDAWDFDVIPSDDFSNAQVTSGGIDGNEINENTLESKIAPNIYLCGEAIDVDGDCGGYNLQFAFSSGMCVGENI